VPLAEIGQRFARLVRGPTGDAFLSWRNNMQRERARHFILFEHARRGRLGGRRASVELVDATVNGVNKLRYALAVDLSGGARQLASWRENMGLEEAGKSVGREQPRFSQHGLLHALRSSAATVASAVTSVAPEPAPPPGSSEAKATAAPRFSQHGLLWRLFPEGGERAIELTDKEEEDLASSVSEPGDEHPPTTKRRGSLSGFVSSRGTPMRPSELAPSWAPTRRSDDCN